MIVDQSRAGQKRRLFLCVKLIDSGRYGIWIMMKEECAM